MRKESLKIRYYFIYNIYNFYAIIFASMIANPSPNHGAPDEKTRGCNRRYNSQRATQIWR